MTWHDFSDLATVHFNMAPSANVRFFLMQDAPMVAGAREGSPTYTELVFAAFSFVPRAPKNFYDTLPADKRERSFGLVWMPPGDAARLKVASQLTGENAGRVLDVDESKWYVVAKGWDYLRQGNLNGVIAELIEGPVPDDLPPPPP